MAPSLVERVGASSAWNAPLSTSEGFCSFMGVSLNRWRAYLLPTRTRRRYATSSLRCSTMPFDTRVGRVQSDQRPLERVSVRRIAQRERHRTSWILSKCRQSLSNSIGPSGCAHERRGVAREFREFATKRRKRFRATCSNYLKGMVGTRRLELLTSTVSR
jgi:hypothetical protein